MKTSYLDQSIISAVIVMLALVIYSVFFETGFLTGLLNDYPVILNIFVLSGLCLSVVKLTGIFERKNKNFDPILIGVGLVSMIYYTSALSTTLFVS